MPFVQRDDDGVITAVSLASQPGFAEELVDDDPQLLAFLSAAGEAGDLARTDLEFVRVLEDLLEVLIAKNVLLFTDLPAAAQTKILARQALRRGDNALDLLDDDLRV